MTAATLNNTARYRGCLLGGAVGDALGASVEFLSLAEIRRQFGAHGVNDLAPAYGRLGAITDDTQMTMFTAEGLLRARSRFEGKGICHTPTVLHHAYVRWLHTQGFRSRASWTPPFDGWLIAIPALHQQRAPGGTCISALEGREAGSVEHPLNDSKGCGGVMRSAPAGLVGTDPFRFGCDGAAITHGHPSGYLSAGALALIISRLVDGDSLTTAVREAIWMLPDWKGHGETVDALRAAINAAQKGKPSAETVEQLGKGWVAEEALAIAVYAAAACGEDFERGVRLAVNHSGDSDSTGAIAGNLLGAWLGVEAIPERWLEPLELRAEITDLADDLVTGYRIGEAWFARYPGW